MNPPPDPAPTVIGLLGGIAAGKSTVAEWFVEAGFRLVDADAEARAVVEEPAIRAAIRARFGPGVFDENGALDRQALAKEVFSLPEARRDLEQITHPAIRQRILSALETARQAGQDVVLDAPLLLEGGLIAHCDASLFVASDAESRAVRARARGWEPDELARREASQASLAEKQAAARWILDNRDDLPTTRRRLQEILAELRGGT